MIRGMHGMFYSSNAEALRAFLRDTVGLAGTDVGGGWLIFDPPQADLGVHPTEDDEPASGTADLSFYCDDIHGTVEALERRGVEFTQGIEDRGYGLVTFFKVPGDFAVQLYEPKYVKTETAEAFAGRLMSTLNSGALCLMISIGHRAGLFDAMRDQPPMTSAELAARAALNERYVREWLGAMCTGGIVNVDPETGRFTLPAERAAYLTRAAGADNIAVFGQYMALLGSVEDDILECFKKGGGVPYEKFGRFHEVMAEDSGQSVMSSLESHILPLVPGLRDRLETGIRVLDAGCGRGRIMTRLAELFPRSRFLGIDLSTDATDAARRHAAEKGLANIEFVARDLSDFHETAEPEAFDWITTFDAVHDQARPLNLLRGIHRALRSDGVYLMQDIRGSSHVHKNLDHPIGTFLYTVSCMHCMTVSLAQGGEGLGAMWGEEKTREYLERAGFRSIATHELAHDIQNNWYVVRK